MANLGGTSNYQTSPKDSLHAQRHFDSHCPPIACPITARENSMDIHIIFLVDILNLLLFYKPVYRGKRRFRIICGPNTSVHRRSRFKSGLLNVHRFTDLFWFPMQFKFHSYVYMVCIEYVSRPLKPSGLAIQRRKMRQLPDSISTGRCVVVLDRAYVDTRTFWG